MLKDLARRLYFSYKYDVSLLPARISSERAPNIFDALGNIKSCAIIGRGSSITHCNPIQAIQACDFKIIMNRVLVEELESYIGPKIDAQIMQPPPAMLAVPRSEFERYNMNMLISNKPATSEEFKRFFSYYHGYPATICGMPDDTQMKYEFTTSAYPHKTQCGSILKVLYNIDSLQKIVFAGVDFYRFGYTEGKDDDRVFQKMRKDAKVTSGDPLMEFVFETIQLRNEIHPLTAWFPEILQEYINFPDHPSFQFYSGA